MLTHPSPRQHDRQIAFPTQSVQSSVYNNNSPAVALAEIEEAIPLLVWLHKDAMIAALNREIAAEGDDAASLSHTERQKHEAEVMGDLLVVERDECTLVWRAMDERLSAEHRADCAPQAILQCRLVTGPAVNGRGTSPEHVITFATAQRTPDARCFGTPASSSGSGIPPRMIANISRSDGTST